MVVYNKHTQRHTQRHTHTHTQTYTRKAGVLALAASFFKPLELSWSVHLELLCSEGTHIHGVNDGQCWTACTHTHTHTYIYSDTHMRARHKHTCSHNTHSPVHTCTYTHLHTSLFSLLYVLSDLLAKGLLAFPALSQSTPQ